MGSKYASVFIYDPDDQLSETEMRRIWGCKASSKEDRLQKEVENYMRLAQLRGETVPPEAVMDILNVWAEEEMEIEFVRAGAYWCIFDENVSARQVAAKAKKVSKQISNYVLYAANDDDDVFLAGIITEGKDMGKHAIGEGLSDYGIKRRTNAKAAFEEYPAWQHPEMLDAFCHTDDVFEAQDAFSRLIGIRLKKQRPVEI